jgi:hypothetical protein
MKKIRRYYAGNRETVTDVKRLQFLMYDTETIRHILAHKIMTARKTGGLS